MRLASAITHCTANLSQVQQYTLYAVPQATCAKVEILLACAHKHTNPAALNKARAHSNYADSHIAIQGTRFRPQKW